MRLRVHLVLLGVIAVTATASGCTRGGQGSDPAGTMPAFDVPWSPTAAATAEAPSTAPVAQGAPAATVVESPAPASGRDRSSAASGTCPQEQVDVELLNVTATPVEWGADDTGRSGYKMTINVAGVVRNASSAAVALPAYAPVVAQVAGGPTLYPSVYGRVLAVGEYARWAASASYWSDSATAMPQVSAHVVGWHWADPALDQRCGH